MDRTLLGIEQEMGVVVLPELKDFIIFSGACKMYKFTPSIATYATLVLLGVGVSPLANAAYTFTDLGALDGRTSFAYSINNAGQVAGYSTIDNGAGWRATLWDGGTMTRLDGLVAGGQTLAYGINEAGQVVGQSAASVSANAAAIWNGGVATELVGLSFGHAKANGINTAGQVVGQSFSAAVNAYQATLWNGTSATNLGTLNGVGMSEAKAINNTGQVAGWSDILQSGSTWKTDGTHATVWNGGVATDLGTLGGRDSRALAINDAGKVAGWSYTTGAWTQHATVWENGTITDLGIGEAHGINSAGQVVGWTWGAAGGAMLWNGTTATALNSVLDASTLAAGWSLIDAQDINDNGWIVGQAINGAGVRHAYLLSVTAAPSISAVPEPETYAMLLAGLGLLGFTARRRKNNAA